MRDDEEQSFHPVAVGTNELQPKGYLDQRDTERSLVILSLQAIKDQPIRTTRCPMCGVNPAGSVKKTFMYVPPWVYAGLLLNIIVLMILYYAGRKVVKTELPLCDDCARADKRAHNIRSGSILGLIFGPIAGALPGAALGAPGEWIIGGALAGVVAGIVGMIAAHRKTRHEAIICKMIDKTEVLIEASGHFKEVLLAEAKDVVA